MNEHFHLRTECRLCLAKNLTKVVDLPLTVPGEQLKNSPDEPDPVAIPIDLYQCEACGHVQILHVPPLENLFNSGYTFMPGMNPDLVRHFRKSVEYFLDTFNDHVQFAFELGSNDGVFLDEFRKRTGCRVLGMDPALAPARVAEERGVETLLEFFSDEQGKNVVAQYGNPDLVIANNVFAHNDDLRGMINGISDMLAPGGYFMFEASSLKAVVENYLIGTILHEHLSVHSLASLKPCLAEFGLQLVGARQIEDVQGGAIVGVAQKISGGGNSAVVSRMIADEVAAKITTVTGLKQFEVGLQKKVQQLNADIKARIGNRKIVGYGAARSAPFIIDVLDVADRISCVIDDNPVKKGKYLPVTNIPIIGSDEIDVQDGDLVFLILGWAQTERIVAKLRQQFDRGFVITVYPDFELIQLDERGG